MNNGKVITIEDRIPKLKEERKRKANRRLILYLSIFFLLLLIIIYFQSPLSNVGKITISGNYYLSETEILDTANLSRETSFWNLPRTELETKLLEELPQLASVTIDKKWPNAVSIQVNERNRIAYLIENGQYFPVLENGQVLDSLPANDSPVNAPILVNWNKQHLEAMTNELMKIPQSLIGRISEIHYVPDNETTYDIKLYMNDGFEVRSTIKNFADKIIAYPSIVKEIEAGKKGIVYLTVGSYFQEYENGEEAGLESDR